MNRSLKAGWESHLDFLIDREKTASTEIDETSAAFSGLRDIELCLDTVSLRFEIVLQIIGSMENIRIAGRAEEYLELGREMTLSAVRLFESVSAANVSLDQADVIREHPAYQRAQARFHDVLLEGGGAFMEERAVGGKVRKKLTNIVCGVLSRFAPADDRYETLVEVESLPDLLRRAIGLLFPVLAPEKRSAPPYGIEEGEESIIRSDTVRMPLSQAILYYESELLPVLESELAAEPGDPILSRKIQAIRDRMAEYGKLRFIPRSTPIMMPQNFYTDGIGGYTADGELMVSVPLETVFSSGNNLDRIREMVTDEVTRMVAGRGICPELDREYRRLKRLDSGTAGSSRTPGFKIDTAEGFRILKFVYPALRILDDPNRFRLLLSSARQGDMKAVRTAIETELSGGDGTKFLESGSPGNDA